MTGAPELQSVSGSAAVWQRYDRQVIADLWSTALRTAAGVYLVDPIAADEESLAEFLSESPVAAVIATNENHVRDAPSFCSTFRAPLFSRFSHCLPGVGRFPRDEVPAELTIVDLPGAPAGEIAIASPNGDMVIGDALINFEPHGFAFLPDKYCTDPKQMRRSLRALLDHNFDRLFFAHGSPITRNAYERLESLLASAHV